MSASDHLPVMSFFPAKPTPADVKELREFLKLKPEQLGDALGFRDKGRTVRGWEAGERWGKPFVPTGTAVAAMRYLKVLAMIHETPDDAVVPDHLFDVLPECMR